MTDYLHSFPRQTIQYHSNPNLCFGLVIQTNALALVVGAQIWITVILNGLPWK